MSLGLEENRRIMQCRKPEGKEMSPAPPLLLGFFLTFGIQEVRETNNLDIQVVMIFQSMGEQ